MEWIVGGFRGLFFGRYLDDGFDILSVHICISASFCTKVIVMKKILGLLMMLGLMVSFGGCGGDSDSPTGPSEEITEWRKTFGNGRGNSVQQTVDGGFIVTGYEVGMFLLKTDGQGNEEWRKKLGGRWGNSVQQTVDGGFIVTGRDFRFNKQ